MTTWATFPNRPDPIIPPVRVIADLIQSRGAWVKLTGAYILSKVGPPTYADRGKLARAFVQLAPERMVWGSDWPHPTSPADAKPDDAVLLDLIANWAPDPQAAGANSGRQSRQALRLLSAVAFRES